MSKSALTVLREARELISDPKRWTTQGYARDSQGEFTSALSVRAVCWCAEGAVLRSASDPEKCFVPFDILNEVARRIPKKTSGNQIVAVNDELGHAAVLRMFDAAIASAEKEAQA